MLQLTHRQCVRVLECALGYRRGWLGGWVSPCRATRARIVWSTDRQSWTIRYAARAPWKAVFG